MANITLPRGTAASTATGAQASLYGRSTKTIYAIVDLVNAAAVKGSALAATDVIQAVGIPPHSVISKVYCRVIEAADVATFTVNVGIAGGSEYVSGGQMNATGLLTPTTIAQGRPTGITQAATGTITTANVGTFNYTSTYDTIDVTIASFTGTVPTTGQLVVFVELMDTTVPAGANITDIQ